MMRSHSLLLLALLVTGCASRRPSVGSTDGLVGSKADTTPDPEVVRQFLDRKERWSIKTGADSLAQGIAIDNPRTATVAELTELERPEDLPKRGGPRSDRYPPIETTVYTIDADILRYKLEDDDQDYHVVVRDHGSKSGPTMIVEFPDPSVVTHRSPFWPSIQAARQTFFEQCRPVTKFKRRKLHAKITGVGFFDFIHGQSGVAANGIELHPVLSVTFVDPPTENDRR